MRDFPVVALSVHRGSMQALSGSTAGWKKTAAEDKRLYCQHELRLRPHHIVVAQRYQALVEQALRTIPKRQGRPGVQLADADHLTWAAVTMETNIAGKNAWIR